MQSDLELSKVIIAAIEALPPIGGTSERIWRVAEELSKTGLDIMVYMRLHDRVKEECNLHVFEIPSSRLDLINVLKWLLHLLHESMTSDIVQIECFSPLRSLVLCLLLRPLTRKMILVLHDRQWSCDPQRGHLIGRIKYLLQHMGFELYDNVIVAGEGLKKWYVALHGTQFSDKILVIPNGAPTIDLKDYEKTKLADKYNLPRNTHMVLFFGSMLFGPNISTVRYIYEVSERAAKHFKDLTDKSLLFIVAGKGTERFERTRYVIPLGFVDDIFELLFLVDACVIPHRQSYSGPHVKTLYSFAAAKPVVATADGVKDMPSLKEGIHFLSFRRDDPDSLADVLAKLHQDKDLRERISRNAYVYARSYSWQKIAKMYCSIYFEAANSKRNCS